MAANFCLIEGHSSNRCPVTVLDAEKDLSNVTLYQTPAGPGSGRCLVPARCLRETAPQQTQLNGQTVVQSGPANQMYPHSVGG